MFMVRFCSTVRSIHLLNQLLWFRRAVLPIGGVLVSFVDGCAACVMAHTCLWVCAVAMTLEAQFFLGSIMLFSTPSVQQIVGASKHSANLPMLDPPPPPHQQTTPRTQSKGDNALNPVEAVRLLPHPGRREGTNCKALSA